MKQIVYILETQDDGLHAYVDRDLFFREWGYQLSKNLFPVAYIVDYSNRDSCDYKEYQYELENLI